jgi:hypothetical protein
VKKKKKLFKEGILHSSNAWCKCAVKPVFMWPSKGTMKLGHSRQVVARYWFNQYEMHCEGKLKLKAHNTSYCLIEVVTKAVCTKNH